jgi:Xaa-Pro dipeptidase
MTNFKPLMSQKTTLANLIEAEKIASELFRKIEQNALIKAGKSEKQLNFEIFELAKKEFGIKKHWHKRIVRAGENTLFPYKENPPDLVLKDDEILFFDFGPIIDEYEADYGRTYVLGNNAEKIRLAESVEKAWYEVRNWFFKQTEVSGADLFNYTVKTAEKYGYTFGGEIAGHLIGKFPHEKPNDKFNEVYIHPKNGKNLKANQSLFWILEIHFVDPNLKIGGFFEQLLQ